MPRAKHRDLDFYIEKVQEELRKYYPELRFRVEKWNDHEVTLYYSPYSEEEEYPIVKRMSGIATDAVVDAGYQIYVIPDSEPAMPKNS